MIFTQLNQQLLTLNDLLSELSCVQYNYKIKHLGNASIGGHTRHIIELLQCAISGHCSGKIDYINRNRNLILETDRHSAKVEILNILSNVNLPDKFLKITVDKIEDATHQDISTTYFREIVYNIEHTIHHLALIRVALIDMELNIVNENFGMAYSTIQYKKSVSYATN